MARKFFERTARAVRTDWDAVDKRLPNSYPLGKFLCERSHVCAMLSAHVITLENSLSSFEFLLPLERNYEQIMKFMNFVAVVKQSKGLKVQNITVDKTEAALLLTQEYWQYKNLR